MPKFGFGSKPLPEAPAPIVIETKPLEKTPLNIALPDPIKTKPIQWVVITPENAEQIFKELEAKGQNLALFAMTPDGYQSLSYTISDLRNLINLQRNIILQYKEYYEPQVLDKKDSDKSEEKK